MCKKTIKYYLLCALSLVISLVGLNIHVGVTIYLSRVVVILTLAFIVLTFLKRGKINYPKKILIFIILLFFLLAAKIPSVLIADSLIDAARQFAIYLNLVTLFIIIIWLASDINYIISSLKIYVSVGIFQGVYGIYQTIGPFYSWPTYQTLLQGIPMANDRTVNGYYWSGAHGMFRATGFFSADVSHYAIYLATVCLISMAFIYTSHGRRLGIIGVFFSLIGIILSLSRSGLLSLLIVGIPAFFYLKNKIKFSNENYYKINKTKLIIVILISLLILLNLNIPFQSYIASLQDRLIDLINPGESNTESMSEHVFTRLLGIEAFITNPLLGIGLGENASPWYSEKYKEYWAGSHSHHLNILGQSGIFAALVEWFFMFICIKYMYIAINNERIKVEIKIIIVGILSSCITLVFGNFLYHSFLNDFVWFLFAIGVALSDLATSKK